MSAARQLRLNLNLIASGRHDAAWTQAAEPESLSTNFPALLEAARAAEHYKLDAVFFADYHGGLDPESAYRPWRALDPVPVMAALMQHTRHIGFVGTASALYGNPVQVARAYASLAHLGAGRVAWNIVTSTEPHVASLYGGVPSLSAEQRHAAADDFVETVVGLWRSVPADAVLAQAATNTYLDQSRLKPVSRRSRFFTTEGVLGIPDPGDNRPRLFVAGNSVGTARLAGRWADAVFTMQKTFESARQFYAQVRRARGDGVPVMVLPGLYPVIGSTMREAWERKEKLDAALDPERLLRRVAALFHIRREDLDADKELPYALIEKTKPQVELGAGFREQALASAREQRLNARQVGLNLISGHRLMVGTPESIADDMQHWFDHGAADGFNLNVDVLPEGLALLGETLIPELQRRGLFRREYRGLPLRDGPGHPSAAAMGGAA